MATYDIQIPIIDAENFVMRASSGETTVFVGANGSGKTRLGVEIERQISTAHRIPAQKALNFFDTASPQNLDNAIRQLRYGNQNNTSNMHRWDGKPATQMAGDYGILLSALFSESYDTSVNHLKAHQINSSTPAPTTVLDKVLKVWNKILPHRRLKEISSSIKAYDPDEDNSEYPSSEMSDGERAIFYYIGQCLLTPQDGVIIVDEPELHVHKAIVASLWDAIESERDDCCFIYITHDLEFARTRNIGQKYAVRKYKHGRWDIVPVAKDENFSEDIITRIIGSRRPVLFVEGDGKSLDTSIYKKTYPNFLVVFRGSGEAVIHSTVSFQNNTELHHIYCKGIIDKDDRTPEEISYLNERNVSVLAVTEIENILLYEDFLRILGEKLHFSGDELETKIEEIKSLAFQEADKNKESCAITYVKRQLDKAAKKVSYAGATITDVLRSIDNTVINSETAKQLYDGRVSNFSEAISKHDYQAVIEIYDKKGLLSQVGNIFSSRNLLEYVLRLIKNDDNDTIAFLRKTLPVFPDA